MVEFVIVVVVADQAGFVPAQDLSEALVKAHVQGTAWSSHAAR
jgi:hypothetical protein